MLRCGDKVLTAGGEITATVRAVCVRGVYVSYEIAWWNNGEHEVAWVEESEVELIRPAGTNKGDGR